MLGNNCAIGTSSPGAGADEPVSNRTYEIISAEWAAYRSRSLSDFLIRVNLENTLFVSTEEIAFDQSIKAFPNPASDKTEVYYSFENARDINIQLINPMGQIVSEQKIDRALTGSTELDVSNLAQGVYWLKVGSEDMKSVRKISVIR